MKKLLVCMLIILMAFPAFAEDIDLSGLSYAELVALKDRINLAMWECDEWQEVTVPQGVWIVGEDIPAGYWTIIAAGNYARIDIGTKLDDNKVSIDIWDTDVYVAEHVVNPNYRGYEKNSDLTEFSYMLEEGYYVIISEGNVIFTPYTGKPSLGFK